MGKFISGDVVLDVRKLEPTCSGSSMHEFTDKSSLLFVEYGGMRNMQDHLENLNLARSGCGC